MKNLIAKKRATEHESKVALLKGRKARYLYALVVIVRMSTTEVSRASSHSCRTDNPREEGLESTGTR